MTLDLKRLRETFSDPSRQWILDALRRRLERGQDLTGSITLREPTRDERASLDRLLGRRPTRGKTLTLKLEELEQILRAAKQSDDLYAAAEVLLGSVVNKRARQARLEARWDRLFADVAEQDARPEVRSWLIERRTRQLTRRYSKKDPDQGRSLLNQAFQIIRCLPVPGLPLAEVAAKSTGNSHALDHGQPLGTLVISAAARLGGMDDWRDTEARRDVWASVGVLLDELSAPVLTLNLRSALVSLTGQSLAGQSLTGQALRLHADAGEPYRLSTRQLLRHPPTFDPALHPTIHVCENPSVVAAVANRLGPHSAPLVCVEGQPKTAARLLLGQLSAAGIHLAYHGDFDWGGVRIANLIMERHGASAWRFDSTAYRATRGGQALTGQPVAASWDPNLEVAMLEAGRAVHEEQVIDDLLEDLRGNGDRRC